MFMTAQKLMGLSQLAHDPSLPGWEFCYVTSLAHITSLQNQNSSTASLLGLTFPGTASLHVSNSHTWAGKETRCTLFEPRLT